jgi:hypothetical protein
VDLNLAGFLLAPGIMAWSDGLPGLTLSLAGLALGAVARMQGRAPATLAVAG